MYPQTVSGISGIDRIRVKAVPIKLGHRVTVLPGVSNRKDPGSIQHSPDGIPRTRLEGKRGEVVQIGTNILDVKDGMGQPMNEKPSPVPRGCEGMVLVDDQVVNGQRVGRSTMREWFLPEELEIG